MDNVIRPDFQRAAKARADENTTPRAGGPVQYVKTYGEVGPHAVSLVRARSGLKGDVYHVVIDTPRGQVGPVGVEPATEDGKFDADRVGMAVMRTLELLAGRPGDFDVA
ncbi:hypothetical protein [Methylobacterium sp. SyP6R]|uniref:hypothetical protein n=1 Tax=Methylobacterium sp. SyP6R TaxID=2718876 RepID=UPI001F42E9DF|nr:hypothetical protein [Methylobacterium sp. SyP6R]MCF4129089.1 hypothetical protein [Methylobacterium sp. SyP6R]